MCRGSSQRFIDVPQISADIKCCSGATISPLIATSMVNKYSLQWYEFFYVLASLSVLELGLGSIVWWSETAQTFRQKIAGNKKNRTKDALKEKIMWICCVFMFCYVGVEGQSVFQSSNINDAIDALLVSLGGWIVTFMLQVRNADPYAAGLTATGFWLAVTAGRFSLGFVTPLLGERLAVLVYITLALAFQLVFWLVPSFIVSAVSVALVGYFIGPIFPTAVVLEAKLLPKHLHTSAVGFSVAIGGAGAAVQVFLRSLYPHRLTEMQFTVRCWCHSTSQRCPESSAHYYSITRRPTDSLGVAP